MPRIDGDRLRELRRARGWDVPEMARRLRQASGDSDPLPPSDALVRMVRRWEREGLNTSRAERYELAYARALGVRPGELRERPGTRRPAEREQPQPPARAHAPGVIAALAEALHVPVPDYPARDQARLERDVLLAWELRQSAQYARLAELITDLLRDIGSRQADAVPTVHTLNLASSLAKSLGAHEMSAILSDRAYLAARQSGSALLISAAKMRVANSYLSAGRHAEAIAIAAAAADELPPGRTSAPEEVATFGALVLCAAVAAARMGEPAQAWEFIGQARAAAAACDREQADLYAVFGPANLAIHGVQVATDLGDGREALRRAERIDPGRLPAVLLERRVTLLIDIARAQHMQGSNADAGATLLEAERVAPLEVRYSSAARALVNGLLSGGRVSGEVRALAGRLNVAA
jgi:transcriptional regulator with XRE-family HTH domain